MRLSSIYFELMLRGMIRGHLVVLAVWTAAGAEPPAGLAVVEKRCVACHNAQTAKSGLDVTSRNRLLRGGDRGPAVVPGNAEASLLYKLASHAEVPHMPFQGDRLSDAELNTIAGWI